ncbi:hypothetical protein SRABI133_05179 [Peribacillus simplex]|uniref:Uncharacterized protein n=1 Tax=Peribacillus simplex TaxID=1478 RepID=A0A9W4L5R6_9BACI|nr:hypothetical protein SRABI133_05179 [Peribacillus simplex]
MITKLKDKGIKIEFFIALTGALAELSLRQLFLMELKGQVSLTSYNCVL